MSPARLAGMALAALALASCSLLPSGGDTALTGVDDIGAARPVCAPRGAEPGRAFADAGCRAGDVVPAAPPGVRQAAVPAARACDFGRAVVVGRRDEAGDAGAVPACAYAGRVRFAPE